MKGVATKPVSLFWQVVFAIFIDVFAFYRIKKLRRFLLIVVLPAVMIGTTFSVIFSSINLECETEWLLFFIYDTCEAFDVQIVAALINGGFLVFTIYLVRKWSIEWNRQFE